MHKSQGGGGGGKDKGGEEKRLQVFFLAGLTLDTKSPGTIIIRPRGFDAHCSHLVFVSGTIFYVGTLHIVHTSCICP